MRLGTILLALVLPAVSSQAVERIWIDTDVSIGSPLREVDDAFALVLAFQSRKIAIRGISSSYGNAPLSDTDRIAREMTERFGGTAGLTAQNVSAGAASKRDLGRETAATKALAAALRQGSLTYVALGPLTNLATTLDLHPELVPSVKRVLFVGGTSPGENLYAGHNRLIRIHDANVVKDPRAVERVLKSKVPFMLIPVSIAAQLEITPADMKTLAASQAAGRYLAERSKTWLWFWRTIAGNEGGPIFDAVAIFAAIEPNSFASETRFARLEPDGSLTTTRVSRGGDRRVQFCVRLKRDIKAETVRTLSGN